MVRAICAAYVSSSDVDGEFQSEQGYFFYFYEQLQPNIAKTDTTLRKVLPMEERVAITLWVLATPGKYRTTYCTSVWNCKVHNLQL